MRETSLIPIHVWRVAEYEAIFLQLVTDWLTVGTEYLYLHMFWVKKNTDGTSSVYFPHSSLYYWSIATGWRKSRKWRQSGDMYEKYMGHCM